MMMMMETCLIYMIMIIIFVQSARYDQGSSGYTETGDILQLQYARKAALLGQTIIGGVCSSDNKVLLCIPTKRYVQTLCDTRLSDKIMQVDKHLYIGYSGLAGDGKAITNEARKFCMANRSKLSFLLNPFGLAQLLSRKQQEATAVEGSRPLGVQLLVIGKNIETNQLELILTDPSGDINSFRAVAIGQSSERIMNSLERRWKESSSSSCIEAAHLFTEILTKLQDQQEGEENEKDTQFRIDYFVFSIEGKEMVVCKKYTSLEELTSDMISPTNATFSTADVVIDKPLSI